MSLESLPPELLTIILKSHNSLLDLHNLISASPACLRVFNSASKLILPVVIRKGIPEHDLRSLNKHLERQAHVTQLLNLSSDEYINQFVVDYSYSYTKYEMYEYTSLISYPHVMRNQIERYKLYMRLYNLIQVYSTCLNSLGLDATTFTCTPPKLTSLQEAFLRYGIPANSLVTGAVYNSKTSFPNDRYPKFRLWDRYLSRLAPRKVEKLVCMELYASFFKQGD
jgi:hypothetical protein